MVDHRYDALPGETAEEHRKRIPIIQAKIKAQEKVAEEALNTSQALMKQKDTSQSLQIQNLQEKNMASETEPTEIDFIKQEKIEKQKKEKADVAAAINIAAGLKEDIKQIKDELCVGPNCLKEQVKNKFGEMNSRFGEIDQKIAKIDEKTNFFSCDNCGYNKIPSLSSFCPNCGLKIPSWSNDDGLPVPGWKPYWIEHPEEDQKEE